MALLLCPHSSILIFGLRNWLSKFFLRRDWHILQKSQCFPKQRILRTLPLEEPTAHSWSLKSCPPQQRQVISVFMSPPSHTSCVRPPALLLQLAASAHAGASRSSPCACSSWHQSELSFLPDQKRCDTCSNTQSSDTS
jgi:hypothetical protein